MWIPPSIPSFLVRRAVLEAEEGVTNEGARGRVACSRAPWAFLTLRGSPLMQPHAQPM